MKINLKLTFLLILIMNFVYGQDIVSEEMKNRVLPAQSDSDGGTIAYTDHEKSFTLSFINDNNISICLFDNSFNQKDKALLFKTETGFSDFLNSFGTSEKQILIFEKVGFFAGNSKKKLLAVSYDFESKNTFQKPIELNLENERFLETFTKNDKFYVLTLLNDSSVFRLHIFDSDLNYESKDIDIRKNPLYYNNKLIEFPSRPDYIPKYIFNSESFISFSTVLENEPNDLSTVTQDYKLYVKDNKLVLTLDSNKDLNTLIEIDLDNFSSITKQTQCEFFTPEENKWAKSNSFLCNNKLFLLKGTKEKVSVNVLDLNSKSYVFKQIFDNNTPYYADRNLMISKDILKKHDIPEPKKEKDASIEKRLKKIIRNVYKVGLRVVENKQNYFVTLGAYQQATGSYPMMMGGGFGGFNGGFTNFSVFYSFTKEESLNFYLNKSDFTLELNEDSDPYEKMEDFLDEKYDNKADKKIIWKTKFKKGNDYILGYFDKDEEKYYLRKF